MAKKRLPTALWLSLILLLAAGLRLQHLRADPPRLLATLEGSAGIYFDEGIYSHNARNKLLFGTWVSDEWNPYIYNAPLTGIYYLAFEIGGISIATVKVMTIIFGLVGLIVFFLSVRDRSGRKAALALTLLFSLNYYWLMYNRIGLLENFAALCCLISFYFFGHGRERAAFMFAAGFFVALTVMSKYLFAYFLIAATIAVLYQAWRDRRWRQALYYGIGMTVPWLAWLAAIYLPNVGVFAKISRSWGLQSLPHSIDQALANLATNPLPKFMGLMPLEFILVLVFAGMFIAAFFRKPAAWPEARDVFVFLWLIGAILEMGILSYRPLRYYLPLMPAIYLAISRLAITPPAKSPALWERLLAGLMIVLLAFACKPFFLGLVRSPSSFFVFPAVWRIILLLALVCILILVMEGKPKWQHHGRIGLAVVMAATATFLYHAHFYRHPVYNLEIASDFIKTLPPQTTLLGQEAPRLALETPFHTLMAYEGWFNDEDSFSRYRPTHVIVLDKFQRAEFAWLERRFPAETRRLRLVRRFWVWDSTLSLYRVTSP